MPTIHWFRRDLRLDDNTALWKALTESKEVLGLFIFDTNILDQLEDKQDRRLAFIHQALLKLKEKLEAKGSSLLVKYGKPEEVWTELIETYDIQAVYTNRDYEPYAQERDKAIYQLLESKGIDFKGCKDHVIFEKSEVVKKDGKPYTVFTPYSKVWKKHYATHPPKMVGDATESENFYQCDPLPMLSLADIGFELVAEDFPTTNVPTDLLTNYKEKRNFPGIKGTSRLSVHLRFGTISIRKMAVLGAEHSESWLNELIWRDFYQMILFNFPQVVNQAFKPKYDRIPWRKSEEDFAKWCAGMTGYPMVDAGMRELNATGFMHNRVRMITASFLTKHLLLDWRWGEAYFAKKLIDFELASNNGGWQWASSSGCDAAPYFRIFNPSSQLSKFDKQLVYIKKWLPEYGTPNYPSPMVDHKFARQRALDTYKAALNNQ